MESKHGVLEGAILTTLWNLENSGQYKITVKDIFDNINKESDDKKAYTTIKTVMDRLCIKRILIREKINKKFIYRSAYSNYEMIVKSIYEVAQKYCSNDLNKLFRILDDMRVKSQTVRI